MKTVPVKLIGRFEIERSGKRIAGLPEPLTALPEGRYRPPTRLEALRPGCPNVSIREGSEWDLTPAAVRANRRVEARRAEAEHQRIAGMPVSERKAFLASRRQISRMSNHAEQLRKEIGRAQALAKSLEKQYLRAFALFLLAKEASQSSSLEA
jgi:hypothetical protein